MRYIDIIAKQLAISERQVEKTVELFDSGATIPFISRYRKEVTGNLDEVQVTNIKNLHDKFQEMVKRKETILKTIEGLEKLTDELRNRIEKCWDENELEDIYLPYKPKRRTKAQIAREKVLNLLQILCLNKSVKLIL